MAWMEETDACGRAREVEAIFRPRLETLADKYGVLGDIRGRGAMLAVELVSDLEAKTPDAALTGAINTYCHGQGLVTLTCGTFGNVFRFLPPLSASDELLSEGLDILEDAFANCV